eukprot:6194720-Pleurochrysis_carterae.AAC.2
MESRPRHHGQARMRHVGVILHVAATDDEAVMAAVREDPPLPNEIRSLPAHLLVHLNALETRPEML